MTEPNQYPPPDQPEEDQPEEKQPAEEHLKEDAPWISDDPPPIPHAADRYRLAADPVSDSLLSPSSAAASSAASSSLAPSPLPLVETAFLASAASLMWLVNIYFPPGPLLRILFPLPITLVYLRWNARAAWMAATVSGLLLTILLGPTRSILFVIPYGILGVQLGYLWRRKAGWGISILTGGLLVSFGTFFRIWLLSALAGEDLWGYLIAQITQFIDWLLRILTNWGWIGLGTFGQPGMEVIAIAAVFMTIFASVVYLFTVHLAAWLILERLGIPMTEPPNWVQVLMDE